LWKRIFFPSIRYYAEPRKRTPSQGKSNLNSELIDEYAHFCTDVYANIQTYSFYFCWEKISPVWKYKTTT